MSRPYFPLFIDLHEKPVLIVGAGAVGMRRAGVLVKFGARVRVVAPEMARERVAVSEMAGGPTKPGAGERASVSDAAGEKIFPEEGIVWEQRPFQPTDIDGCFLVIAATDNEDLNGQIVRLCRERGIYVNHAGDQSQCDFYFPAIAMEDDLVAGLTSSGRDHRLVRRIAARLRDWLRRELSEGRP